MAAEGFPVARIDEYAKPCEPAIHVLRSVGFGDIPIVNIFARGRYKEPECFKLKRRDKLLV